MGGTAGTQGRAMHRGLAGSEQGMAPKRNSAGTSQPLMHREGIGLVPNRTNWQSGNRASTVGTQKTVWKGMQAAREDEGSLSPQRPAGRGPAAHAPALGTLTDLRDVCRNLMDMTKIKKDSKYLTAINPSGRESILKKKKNKADKT